MRYITTLLLLVILTCGAARTQNTKELCLAFYNVENLYDTINDPGVNDGALTPTGQRKWDTRKYRTKISKLQQVIRLVDADVLGLCEIENYGVLHDLAPSEYGIVHYDSPDIRGIDVALLYRRNRLKVISSEPIKACTDTRTRDILKVVLRDKSGTKFTLYVVHLPSRLGDNPRTHARRFAIIAQLDSLTRNSSGTIVMGDFNENPQTRILPGLHNSTLDAFTRGTGSYAYRDVWYMFDQIYLSYDLRNKISHKATPLHHESLVKKSGRYKGYPNKGNPSDHLPVFVKLKP